MTVAAWNAGCCCGRSCRSRDRRWPGCPREWPARRQGQGYIIAGTRNAAATIQFAEPGQQPAIHEGDHGPSRSGGRRRQGRHLRRRHRCRWRPDRESATSLAGTARPGGADRRCGPRTPRSPAAAVRLHTEDPGARAELHSEILDRDVYDEIVDVQFDDDPGGARIEHRRGHPRRHFGGRQRVWAALELAKRPEERQQVSRRRRAGPRRAGTSPPPSSNTSGTERWPLTSAIACAREDLDNARSHGQPRAGDLENARCPNPHVKHAIAEVRAANGSSP